MVFYGEPHEIPAGTVKQDYWNRKMLYAINVQVIGNNQHLINVDWRDTCLMHIKFASKPCN
jgi:hypothetical protein